MNIICLKERWLFTGLLEYVTLEYCGNLSECFYRVLDLKEKNNNTLIIDYAEFSNNLNKSLFIMDLMLKDQFVNKVIFLSTYGVYKPQYNPYKEESDLNPKNKNGLYALFGENIMKFFANIYENASFIVLRLFNIYGPYQPTNYIVSSILHQIAFSEVVRIGPLNRMRDFLFIEDLARVINEIINDGNTHGLKIYNVGTGKETSIDALVKLCLKISGKEKKVIFDPSKLREEYDYDYAVADIEKISNDYGWKPRISLPEGLKITYNWIIGGKGMYV